MVGRPGYRRSSPLWYPRPPVNTVPADHYARSGERWALGAELVYGPIAAELVGSSPHPLAGRIVLDAGAGTGAASAALRSHQARPLAVDMSPGMLAWRAASRPPCAVADIRALPLGPGSVDDAVAAFVLNHLTDPGAGLAELIRVTRPAGAVLAAVFGNDSHNDARDRIDAAALAAGWGVPDWYRQMKDAATPLLGTAAAMATAAHAAGLTEVHAEERHIDVGVTQPRELVKYRLSSPIFADWLDAIGPHQAQAFAARAEEAVGSRMTAFRPGVVFLRALVPAASSA
jgi:ubiquinone/menaquinone biosynthesis C-methylase UbiE